MRVVVFNRFSARLVPVVTPVMSSSWAVWHLVPIVYGSRHVWQWIKTGVFAYSKPTKKHNTALNSHERGPKKNPVLIFLSPFPLPNSRYAEYNTTGQHIIAYMLGMGVHTGFWRVECSSESSWSERSSADAPTGPAEPPPGAPYNKIYSSS